MERFARQYNESISGMLSCFDRILFKVVPGEGRPRLVAAPRKCLCFYFYFLDPKLGLVHVRIQSWFPLVVQVCLNGHDILAAVEPPVEAMQELRHLARSKRRGGRPHRGFNPLAEDDLRLFAALFRGEHTLHGMRNQDVRAQLFGETTHRDLRRRQASKVSRLFRRLHVHGLVAKIPRSRRWRLTKRGNLLVSVFLKCHYDKYPELLAALAA